MPVRGATAYFYEKRDGSPRKIDVSHSVADVLYKLRRYWADPYSNLGFWKSVNHNKSHPGTYSRRFGMESDGADD